MEHYCKPVAGLQHAHRLAVTAGMGGLGQLGLG